MRAGSGQSVVEVRRRARVAGSLRGSRRRTPERSPVAVGTALVSWHLVPSREPRGPRTGAAAGLCAGPSPEDDIASTSGHKTMQEIRAYGQLGRKDLGIQGPPGRWQEWRDSNPQPPVLEAARSRYGG